MITKLGTPCLWLELKVWKLFGSVASMLTAAMTELTNQVIIPGPQCAYISCSLYKERSCRRSPHFLSFQRRTRPQVLTVMSSQSPKDRSTPLSASESSPTIRVSSSLDLASPLVVSPSRTSPKTSSPAASPLKSRRDSTSTARDQAPLSVPPIYSALSLPGNLGDSGGSSFRSRSRSPLGQIDDTITQWRNALLSWWNEHKGENVELQEPVPGWQQTKMVSIDEMRISVAFSLFDF
jgi:hypothetical protein